MSDATPDPLNLRTVLVRIDRDLAESAKLRAEQGKLAAEQAKPSRDTALSPWVQIGTLVAAVFSALAALTAVLVAALRH